jgi:hypothetical protein
VQYASTIPPTGPIPWITIPLDVTSATSSYSFIDDGTFTGPSTPFRMYRLLLIGL